MAHFLVPQRLKVVTRPCILEETLPAGHLARFIWSVFELLDFSEIEALYLSVQKHSGRPPYHPRVLSALWIYGMTQGMETASEIAEACTLRDDIRWLAGGLSPCDQTLLNFLSTSKEKLPSIWEQLLKAMHAAGHIDLSLLAEDGTKLRVNASNRSFHGAKEIAAVAEKLRGEIARALEEVVSPEAIKKRNTSLRSLQSKLKRAELAAKEVERRSRRRAGVEEEQPSMDGEGASPLTELQAPSQVQRVAKKFGSADFRLDPERNIMLCPGEKELRFVGVYSNDTGNGSFRLYKRLDCGDCPLKARCTDAKGRRVKILVKTTELSKIQTQNPGPESTVPPVASSQVESQPSQSEEPGVKHNASGPQGSLTEPEAVLMLATSEKRFEPSYNADITVTRRGVIVSQFLTKEAVDFGHFRLALPNVLSTFGRPENWAADGHYATQANLLLADREKVTLYAPTRTREEQDNGKFTIDDFKYDPNRKVMICPAGQDLEMIGTYSQAHNRHYDLFGRKDCTGCDKKSKCTDIRGKRIKKFHPNPLVQALEERMEKEGEKMRKFRGSTVEPVNSQLKQRGLGRFHVRGLSRCATVLTLSCIAHNLLKWKSMEEVVAMKAVS
jgi:transposase